MTESYREVKENLMETQEALGRFLKFFSCLLTSLCRLFCRTVKANWQVLVPIETVAAKQK